MTNDFFGQWSLSHQSSVRAKSSFDLHALSTPPAFVLDQDQILKNSLQLLAVSPQSVNRHSPIGGGGDGADSKLEAISSTDIGTTKKILNPDTLKNIGAPVFAAGVISFSMDTAPFQEQCVPL